MWHPVSGCPKRDPVFFSNLSQNLLIVFFSHSIFHCNMFELEKTLGTVLDQDRF
jgi:hypothetical protein